MRGSDLVSVLQVLEPSVQIIEGCMSCPWRAVSLYRNPCEFDSFQNNNVDTYPEQHLCRANHITASAMRVLCSKERKLLEESG